MDERRAILVVATLSSFVTPFMAAAVAVALPAMGADLAAGAADLGWIATIYVVAAAVGLVPVGRLADIHGRRRMLGWGLVVFTLASLGCALAATLGQMLAARALQGIGSAMIFATGLALVTSAYGPGQSGRALGLNVAAVYVGLSSGPYLGGLLTAIMGWRSIFGVTVLMGLPVIGLAFRGIRGQYADAGGQPMDWAGTGIYGAAVASLALGLGWVPEARGWALLGAGLMGLAGFGLWEHRVKAPVFEVRLLLRNRVFGLSSLAALIHYGATFGFIFMMSLYLQWIRGLGPQQAGLLLVSQPCMMALLSPLAGRLSDRVEPRFLASAGMGMTAAGLLYFAGVGPDAGLGGVTGWLLFMGAGFGLFSAPNMNAIMTSVQRAHYGTASGTVATMRLLGQMLSMGVATLGLSLFLGEAAVGPATAEGFLGGMHLTLGIYFVLALLGMGASLVRGALHGRDGEAKKGAMPEPDPGCPPAGE